MLVQFLRVIMVKTDNLKEDILQVLSKYSKTIDQVYEILPSHHLIDDLAIKSAQMIDVILEIEEKYDIEVEPEDIDNMFTVDDIEKNLVKYLK